MILEAAEESKLLKLEACFLTEEEECQLNELTCEIENLFSVPSAVNEAFIKAGQSVYIVPMFTNSINIFELL